jgi:lysophospholipid acyltransferase (LPLAT)-like uncharacterized protein
VTVLKHLGSNAAVRRAASWLVAGYVRLIYRIGDWTTRGGENPAAFWDRGEPFILAFWHGRLLMIPRIWPRHTAINILTSQHRDGDLSARAISHFGLKSVPGSSRRGGSAALRTMVRAIANGQCAGIAPDGPRGPIMRASDGIIALARLSGAAIVPVSYGASRRHILKTWDRFVVPLPFAAGVFVWGEALAVPRDADAAAIEAARRELETRLNAITAEADRLCGQRPLAPAAESAPR